MCSGSRPRSNPWACLSSGFFFLAAEGTGLDFRFLTSEADSFQKQLIIKCFTFAVFFIKLSLTIRFVFLASLLESRNQIGTIEILLRFPGVLLGSVSLPLQIVLHFAIVHTSVNHLFDGELLLDGFGNGNLGRRHNLVSVLWNHPNVKIMQRYKLILHNNQLFLQLLNLKHLIKYYLLFIGVFC